MTWRRIGAMCLMGWGLAAGNRAAQAQGTTVTVTIDAKANRHPISPLIYGVAYADDAALKDLSIPLHRYGGNNATRYNWQLNADNRANDWYFESIADASARRRRARRHLHRPQQSRRRADHAHHPHDRLGGEGRAEPEQTRRLLHREVRRSDRQRRARISRTRATAS